jgi:hypothetical protein
MEITMTKLQELNNTITNSEEAAGLLDPKDYEGLYKILVVAYFAAKDIIALQDPLNVVLEDVNMGLLEDEVDSLKTQLVIAKATIAQKEEYVDSLNTIVDASNKEALDIQVIVENLLSMTTRATK